MGNISQPIFETDSVAWQLVLENKILAYTRELRDVLPPHFFLPVKNRLVWLAAHFVLIGAATFLIASGIGGWWVTVPASILIGNCFGCLAFVAHEILHGAVVKSRGWQLFFGWFGFLPFTISPRLWVAWHNHGHHGHTMNLAGDDPDAGTTLECYRQHRHVRILDHITVGTRRPAGILCALVGFNGQSIRVFLTMALQKKYLSPKEFAFALLETALQVAVWTTLAFVIGFVPFVFAFMIPLVIGNAVIMSYILTNHNLSPLAEVNDPLLNSLSVTVPSAVDVAHLNFGYHVEHHLFPKMSSRYAKAVREELLKRWPERYQAMPLHRAVGRLWTTTRIYSTPTMLHDPRTGREWPTLLPVVDSPRGQ